MKPGRQPDYGVKALYIRDWGVNTKALVACIILRSAQQRKEHVQRKGKQPN